MPIVLIIVAVAVALGVGTYVMNTNDATATPSTLTTTREETVPADTMAVPAVTTDEAPAETSTLYKDGDYTTTTTYLAPNRASHNVEVTLTIINDIVTASTVTFSGDKVEGSTINQNNFLAAYETEVIGKPLGDISLSRVGGASLTSAAFNEAVGKIAADATI